MDSTTTPVPSRRRLLRKSVMHALRRAHLYCGLLMLPFVILYGITAFLFNHPGAFPDRQMITFGSDDVAGTSMEGLPTPVDVANQVVSAINANGKTTYQLVEPDTVRYERDGYTATVKTSDGKSYNVIIDLDGTTGTVIVDAMAFIMVFWGITGILMWWQIKTTRRFGMVVLLASVGIALWVGIAMHQTISSAPTPQSQAPAPMTKMDHGPSKKGR